MQPDKPKDLVVDDPGVGAEIALTMRGTNGYWQQLNADDLASDAHREMVGGLWDEVGSLQFAFLYSHGLERAHRLLDVGCGSLRGGVHFVRYLDPGCYYGLDVNASLLEGGRRELAREDLSDRGAHLLCDDEFALHRFATQFDFILAISVFTHLHIDQIQLCLCEVADALAADGVFYATYFPAPAAAWRAPLKHAPAGVVTRLDRDPFHQHEHDYRYLAAKAGLSLKVIGDWGHPRGQHMLAFRRADQVSP